MPRNMSAFRRFGIEHLSPSSLNLWVAAPGLWTLRYLAGVKDEGSPAMWRGSAVEDGFSHLLRGRAMAEAEAAALNSFELNAQGELSDDLDKERASIAPMLKVCAAWIDGDYT